MQNTRKKPKNKIFILPRRAASSGKIQLEPREKSWFCLGKSDFFTTDYIDAFHKIDNDPNQYLMVVELDAVIVGTCHLTIMPSLTFLGATRMQIEAVRVHSKHRGKKIGQWMIEEAIFYGKSRSASIIQLTTNKQRPDALHFYEKLGFTSSHEGMKLQLKN